jgi:hypothetical protein
MAFVLMITREGRVDAGYRRQIGRGCCDGLDSRFFVIEDERYRLWRPFSGPGPRDKCTVSSICARSTRRAASLRERALAANVPISSSVYLQDVH